MKAVLFTSGDPLQPTGGHIYNQKLCHHLVSMDVSCETIVLPENKNTPRETTYTIPEKFFKTDLHSPDIILLDGLVGAFMEKEIVDFKKKNPKIKWIYINHLPLYLNKVKPELLQKEEEAMRSCDCVVVTGRYAKELLLSYYNNLNSELITPGTTAVTPRATYNDELKTILMVGSVIERKGYNTVIHALGKFRTLNNWRLVIAGSIQWEKEYVTYLNRLIKQHLLSEKIELLGETNEIDIVKEYKSADLFVSASTEETFGRSAEEAIQFKIPVVLSSIPPYLYRFSKTPVEWFKPNVSNQLSQIFGKYLLSPKEYISLTKKWKNWEPTPRSWTAVANDWKNLLLKLPW
ncbi:MAG: glycosyltransferase [Cyclobacteriaceae bacterium]|nr:glycosyltransferase [Cyclobacteriaceae bacterium]